MRSVLHLIDFYVSLVTGSHNHSLWSIINKFEYWHLWTLKLLYEYFIFFYIHVSCNNSNLNCFSSDTCVFSVCRVHGSFIYLKCSIFVITAHTLPNYCPILHVSFMFYSVSSSSSIWYISCWKFAEVWYVSLLWRVMQSNWTENWQILG